MRRRARIARALQKIAHGRGLRPSFRLCYRVVAAANAEHISAAVLMALVEQESGFQFIFGHDAGGPFPGQRVTKRRYRKLVARVRAGGTSNGVGYVQATWGPALEESPGLWKPKANLRWGARFQRGLGLSETGFNAYNGDPSGAYGRERVAITNAYKEALR